MNLTILTMVRNEADRWLPSLLRAWGEFADHIIAYEDHSEDNTRAILEDAGCEILEPVVPQAWGNEAPARRRLWDAGVDSGADWLMHLDADMCPASDPGKLIQGHNADALAFPLYDLWTPDGLLYREDTFWQAHLHPRIWAVRNPGKDAWIWPERGIHCGHLPQNLKLQRVLTAPKKFAIMHYGYTHAHDRELKYHAYTDLDILSEFEREHAESILDPNPRLLPLDVDIQWPITKSSAVQ
jgi:hypothetical protein